MPMTWLLLKPATKLALPPTYNNTWRYMQSGFNKRRIGCAFIVLGVSGIVLLPAANISPNIPAFSRRGRITNHRE